MYNDMIIAIDSSEFSRAAVIEAANLIKKHSGNAVLVHGVYFDEEEYGNAPEILGKRVERGKKLCQDTKEMAASEFGIDMECLVREGEPPDVITEEAKKRKAGLIVMGTRGKKGLKRMIMGSVTSSVIVNSHCDVLVVKKPCSKCTGEYKSVLLPFDGSDLSKNALIKACSLARLHNAMLTALYVIPRYEEMINFYRTETIMKSLKSEAQGILGAAKETASDNGFGFLRTEIREGQAGEEIIKAAAELDNDLIVMGSHGYRGVNKAIIGSTAERVIINASCPILIAK